MHMHLCMRIKSTHTCDSDHYDYYGYDYVQQVCVHSRDTQRNGEFSRCKTYCVLRRASYWAYTHLCCWLRWCFVVAVVVVVAADNVDECSVFLCREDLCCATYDEYVSRFVKRVRVLFVRRSAEVRFSEVRSSHDERSQRSLLLSLLVAAATLAFVCSVLTSRSATNVLHFLYVTLSRRQSLPLRVFGSFVRSIVDVSVFERSGFCSVWLDIRAFQCWRAHMFTTSL